MSYTGLLGKPITLKSVPFLLTTVAKERLCSSSSLSFSPVDLLRKRKDHSLYNPCIVSICYRKALGPPNCERGGHPLPKAAATR
jgi:hypothetical protein